MAQKQNIGNNDASLKEIKDGQIVLYAALHKISLRDADRKFKEELSRLNTGRNPPPFSIDAMTVQPREPK